MDEADDELEKATALVKTGRLKEARGSLLQFLRQNPSSEQAWLLMSYTVSDPAQQKDCLQRVLVINPENSVARSKLALLENPTPRSGPTPATSAREIIPPTYEPPPPPLAPAGFSIPNNDAAPEVKPVEPAPIPAVAPTNLGRLSRLRNRAQASEIPTQLTGAQFLKETEPSPEPEKKDSELQESFQMDNQGRRKLLPIIGILAAVLVVILLVVVIANGSLPFLQSPTPTPTPTATPAPVVELPPAWTKTATPTVTITPIPSETPTLTITPTSMRFVSRTPTKPKPAE
jgi:hypothetical protein